MFEVVFLSLAAVVFAAGVWLGVKVLAYADPSRCVLCDNTIAKVSETGRKCSSCFYNSVKRYY